MCEQASVVVVSSSAAGRAAAGRPVWLGLVGDVEATDELGEPARSVSSRIITREQADRLIEQTGARHRPDDAPDWPLTTP